MIEPFSKKINKVLHLDNSRLSEIPEPGVSATCSNYLGCGHIVRARLFEQISMYKFIKHQIVSTLEIPLSNIHRDVLVLLEVADVHQCRKVDFPCRAVCLL